MRTDLPAGTVTFLFTDVEGSTKLLHELGAEGYADALADHRRVIREAVAARGGVEVDTQGDAFFVAFPTAPAALAAAAIARDSLADGPIRVRIGLHSGTPLLTDEGYVGGDVHRAARIAASGHGGQILVSASTAALVDSGQLRDLGRHRLKDLSAPERIYQLGDEDFPPLKSLHQTNLPIAATPFVGREKELPEILHLLAQDDVRLLTLTGPGGTGKTRLAAQAAALLAERYPDGVWWVPLGPLRDPDLVLPTAGEVLGAKDGLAEHVADKSLLLLFDNFEQVVAAAADVAAVLSACPNADFLVTSREPLHVLPEHEYPIPPFAHEEGVGFFLARARAVDPGFETDEKVSEICRRLDDLPLALELAAARVKALSSEQLLQQLEQRLPVLTGGARDLPERQRTLRATIEWSYDLLTTDEQRLFAELAIFAGGWTFEDAVVIVHANLNTLQSLLDKNLLRQSRGRYSVLETIREYAGERLDELGDAAELRRRHAEHFVALAEAAEPHVPAYELEWIERLQREHDNLRLALDWLEATGESELFQRLAGALARFWMTKGHVKEGFARAERAVAASEKPTVARVSALNGAALLGQVSTQKAYAEAALALGERLGDRAGTARAKLALAAALSADDMAATLRLYEESAALFRELGDEHQVLIATRGLAWAYLNVGERERSHELHETNLRRARALGNRRMEAITLGALATFHVEEGRLDVAAPMLEESHRLHQEVGDPVQTAFDVFRFSMLLASAGKAETAATLVAAADALASEAGIDLHSWDPAAVGDTLAKARAGLDERTFEGAQARGRTLTADEAFALGLGALPD